jgi:hypothetical protein
MKYYIKERHNPQFKEPYYVACGKLSAKEAKKKEDSLYGFNIMLSYKTEKEYKEACEKFKIN